MVNHWKNMQSYQYLGVYSCFFSDLSWGRSTCHHAVFALEAQTLTFTASLPCIDSLTIVMIMMCMHFCMCFMPKSYILWSHPMGLILLVVRELLMNELSKHHAYYIHCMQFTCTVVRLVTIFQYPLSCSNMEGELHSEQDKHAASISDGLLGGSCKLSLPFFLSPLLKLSWTHIMRMDCVKQQISPVQPVLEKPRYWE